jgi:hypothetical protein
MRFGDLHRKYLPIEHWPSKISVETYRARCKPDDWPLPPYLPFLFDLDWSDVAPPEVSAGSEMDGR